MTGSTAAGRCNAVPLRWHISRVVLVLHPLQVIASNDICEDMNQLDVPVFWPERRYPWGTAQAFNPEHSDLFFLRFVLGAGQVGGGGGDRLG